MTIEPIGPQHHRLGFTCGDEVMERYLQETAHQAKKKGLAATFIGTEAGNPHKICGYYSLSQFMIRGAELPDVVRKKRKLPSHDVGATLLGRLAVASDRQGRGYGELLLVDALKRVYACSQEIAGVCVVADAIDERRAGFSTKYGFERIGEDRLRMVLMMDTIVDLMGYDRPTVEQAEETA